mgnify:CR=1 FL=1
MGLLEDAPLIRPNQATISRTALGSERIAATKELKRILEELTLKFKDSLKRLPTPSDINKIEELLNI